MLLCKSCYTSKRGGKKNTVIVCMCITFTIKTKWNEISLFFMLIYFYLILLLFLCLLSVDIFELVLIIFLNISTDGAPSSHLHLCPNLFQFAKVNKICQNENNKRKADCVTRMFSEFFFNFLNTCKC